MNINEIEKLIRLLEASTLTVLEVSEGESRIHLEKQKALGNCGKEETYEVRKPQEEKEPKEEKVAKEPNEAAKDETAKAVKSPMVGVFYPAASPEDEPFVKVGDRVKKGDVLCILEAMKLMNEISAEADGEILEVCLKSGEVAEYGRPLFYIR